MEHRRVHPCQAAIIARCGEPSTFGTVRVAIWPRRLGLFDQRRLPMGIITLYPVIFDYSGQDSIVRDVDGLLRDNEHVTHIQLLRCSGCGGTIKDIERRGALMDVLDFKRQHGRCHPRP
jgi:hypothetical protein